MAKRARKTTKQAPKPAKTALRSRKRPAAKPRPAKRSAKRAAKRSSKRAAKRVKAAVETLRTPPSSLDLERSATAARSGRHILKENQRRHSKMDVLTGGDADADMESAYFTGDETPVGDNPTPDQSDVDEIGHAMGVEYQDNEELKGSDKVAERDKHRWDTE